MKLVALMTWVEGPFRVPKVTTSLGKKYNKCCVFTRWRRRWPWRSSGRYNASTRPMAAYSGFAWSHQYALLGNVPRVVSPRRHGRRNHRQICYIVYKRVANKSINSLTVNGFNLFASTTPPPDPFGRVYPRPIGRIHTSHAVKGHGGNVVDCCVCGVEYFPYYSYSRKPTGREFFVPARTHIG